MIKENKKSVFIVIGEKEVIVEIENGKFISIDGEKKQIDIEKQVNGDYKIVIDGKTNLGQIDLLKQNEATISINGNTYNLSIETQFSYERKTNLTTNKKKQNIKIAAPLPGLVTSLFVAPNQTVNKGDTLLILEAMKMQNEIQSSYTGLIKKINITKGENVMKDQILIEIEMS